MEVPAQAWGHSGQVSTRTYPHTAYEEIVHDGHALGAVWQHPSGTWRSAPWWFPGEKNTSAGYVYSTTAHRTRDDAIRDVLYYAHHKIWEAETSLRTAQELDELPENSVIGDGKAGVWQKISGRWYTPARVQGLSAPEVLGLDLDHVLLLQRP